MFSEATKPPNVSYLAATSMAQFILDEQVGQIPSERQFDIAVSRQLQYNRNIAHLPEQYSLSMLLLKSSNITRKVLFYELGVPLSEPLKPPARFNQTCEVI